MSAELLRFSKAEMAVVFQHVWGEGTAPTETMLIDLNLDRADLDAGRRSLVERGLLFADSRRGDSALSPSLEPILGVVTRPQVLGVLQVTTSGKQPQSAYFCWTPEAIVFNRVTEAGDHILDTLPSLEATGEAAVQFSSLSRFKKARQVVATDPEAVAQAAAMRGVFMAVSDPAAPQPATQALAWLVSRDDIWLVQSGESETPQFMLATAAMVATDVVALMRFAVETIPHTQSGDGKGAGRATEGGGGSK